MGRELSDVVDELEFIKGSLVLVEMTPYRTLDFKKSMVNRGIALYQENIEILDEVMHDDLNEYRVWIMNYMIRNNILKIPDYLDGVSIPGTSTIVKRDAPVRYDVGYDDKRTQ